MIEKIVLDYLNDNLENIKAYMEHPAGKDAVSFVVLQKTGSSRENFVNRATFAIQSYAGTLYESATLNEKVKEIMDGLAEVDRVASSKLNSDYNYTDTTSKKYRYQCVYDVVYV